LKLIDGEGARGISNWEIFTYIRKLRMDTLQSLYILYEGRLPYIRDEEMRESLFSYI
jgi:hypothetical protein